MGFIYKITNTITNKCYIGETTKPVEERWRQHIQLAKKGKGCPALTDAINAHGLENFTFEVILNCPDEERFYREIEMIKQYNSQVPNGYNILPGGICGGGFIGKKHTPETIDKIKESGKKFREENPNFFETYREKLAESMKNVDTSSAVKNSEKFRKAVEEGRVGANGHKDGKLSEETKKKISESVTKYFKEKGEGNPVNIENHRIAMTKAVGKKIAQYNEKNEFVAEYPSISEAARQTNMTKGNIQHVLRGDTIKAGGFYWKYIEETEESEESTTS
jgi:group I intron endonuclease